MARTQFHSAATGVPRTQFHAHKGIRIEEVSSLLDAKLPLDSLEKIDSLKDFPAVVTDVKAIKAILVPISEQPSSSPNPSPADVDRSQP
jgi:hypothetical protein